MEDNKSEKTRATEGLSDEEAIKYCKRCYERSKPRIEDIQRINLEHRQFYEGIDPLLEERKENKQVERSALFVQEISPAVDTRISNAEAAIRRRENPVSIRANDEQDEEKRKLAARIEADINRQMKECGYLYEGFREHALAAEMQRVSTVQVNWVKKKVAIPAVENGKLVKKYEERGYPTANFISPETFFFEPDISDMYEDSAYAIRVYELDSVEALSVARQNDWDVDVLKKYLDENEIGLRQRNEIEPLATGVKKSREEVAGQVEKEDRVLITEHYNQVVDEDGNDSVDYIVLVGLDKKIDRKKDPLDFVPLPFVNMTSIRLPRTLESICSVERGKYLQRVINETYNIFLDGHAFTIYPPMKCDIGLKAKGQLIMGPGRLWPVTKSETLVPLNPNPGQVGTLLTMTNVLAGRLRTILNADPTMQGFVDNQYEKASVAVERFQNQAKRSLPTLADYGSAVIRIAQMFIGLNQQFAENGADFYVEGGLTIDVPDLTSATDPEQRKNDAQMMYMQAAQNPIYQMPFGLPYLLAFWRQVVESWQPENVDEFAPTRDELKAQMVALEKVRQLEQEIMAQQESMALAQGTQPAPPQAQEATSG